MHKIRSESNCGSWNSSFILKKNTSQGRKCEVVRLNMFPRCQKCTVTLMTQHGIRWLQACTQGAAEWLLRHRPTAVGISVLYCLLVRSHPGNLVSPWQCFLRGTVQHKLSVLTTQHHLGEECLRQAGKWPQEERTTGKRGMCFLRLTMITYTNLVIYCKKIYFLVALLGQKPALSQQADCKEEAGLFIPRLCPLLGCWHFFTCGHTTSVSALLASCGSRDTFG